MLTDSVVQDPLTGLPVGLTQQVSGRLVFLFKFGQTSLLGPFGLKGYDFVASFHIGPKARVPGHVIKQFEPGILGGFHSAHLV